MADVGDVAGRMHRFFVDRTRHHRRGLAARRDAGRLFHRAHRGAAACGRDFTEAERSGTRHIDVDELQRRQRDPSRLGARIERPTRTDDQRSTESFERAARERFRQHFRADAGRIAGADRDDRNVSTHRMPHPKTVYSYSMVTLADLVARFELHAVCIHCRRMERIDLTELMHRFPETRTVEEVRDRVRCRGCRRRTRDIRIVYVGTNGNARGFHYRAHQSHKGAAAAQSPSSSLPSSVSPKPDTPT